MLKNALHVKMARSKKKGRHLVATSDLTPGTVIIQEEAFAAVSNSPFYCSNCFCRLLSAALDRPYVCRDCRNESLTGFSRNDKSLVILCYKIVLSMLLQDQFSFEAFFREKSNSKSSEDDLYCNDFRAVAKLVTVDLDVSDSDIKTVCRMVQKKTSGHSKDQITSLVRHVFSTLPCNVQGIRCITETDGNFSDERIGSGLYLSLALMNHSCSPNTRIYFEKSTVVVVTTTKVKEGEEIYHNYGPNVLHFPKNERQQILARQYQFTCDCTACSVAGEEEPQYALRCKHCSASIWLQSDVPKCCSCRRFVDFAKISRRLYFLHQKLADVQDNPDSDVDFVNGIVDEAMQLYSSENVTFGNIMDTCASFYASKKVWEKAISCAKLSCSVVEKAIGTLNQTYAIELLKFCEIRMNSLEHDTLDEHLLEDIRFCVEILQQYKSHGLDRLHRVMSWSKLKA
ncbi:hypothetical protein ACHWQZ_G011121 [Mnemiopsis leidyi]